MIISQTAISAFEGSTRAWKPPLTAVNLGGWVEAESRWARLAETGTALAFQRAAWLGPWYRHSVGPGVEPLIVFVQDARSGRDVLALPLVRRTAGWKRVITFADGGLTDYNAPVLGDIGNSPQTVQALWPTLRGTLQADLIRFEKMPVHLRGVENPMAKALPGLTPSSLTGNILHVPGTWEAWQRGLERSRRKEIERLGRVFDRQPGSAFRRYEAGPEADKILESLNLLQATRIAELKLPYILDREPARGFYDTIAREGLRNGTAVLTALFIGDEVVAVLLGIADGSHYAMTRLATSGPRWKHISAGRVLIEKTMRMLHAEGYRAFDFTIGAYEYKRRLGVTSMPMVETTIALSPRGWAEMARVRTTAALRQNPSVRQIVRKLRGAPGCGKAPILRAGEAGFPMSPEREGDPTAERR